MQKKYKEEKVMKLSTKKLTFENPMLHLIAIFGAMFAFFGANAGCMIIFHQPEKPDLSKLRKF